MATFLVMPVWWKNRRSGTRQKGLEDDHRGEGVRGLDSAKKVVIRAVTAIACRYLLHAGGDPVVALEQLVRGLRLAQRKYAAAEAFAATTMPVARA